jgi:uncharacterized phiE125 gp8 family phage protein
MVTILERTYPASVIADIVSNHLKVVDDGDELRSAAEQCVRDAFDMAEAYTNRRIIDTLATLTFHDIDTLMELPTSPIKEVVEVRYLGADNAWHSLTEDSYIVESNEQRATLELAVLPALSPNRKGSRFEVSVRCGYDEEGEHALPGTIRRAVALLAGTNFSFQGDTVVGSTSELPMCARNLLNSYRIYPYEY